MSDYRGVTTLVGQQLIAGSIGGSALTITSVRVGDGAGAPINPVETMTGLVRQVAIYPVSESLRDAANPTQWRVACEIPYGDGPFDIREVAAFTQAGQMVAIASHALFEKRPGVNSGTIGLVFTVSETANVSVAVTPSTLTPLTRLLRMPFVTVNGLGVTAPPANPAAGALYVIGDAPTGAFVGQARKLAEWTGYDWRVLAATDGLLVRRMGSLDYFEFVDGAWSLVPSPQNVVAQTLITNMIRGGRRADWTVVGAHSWTAPADVRVIEVECWGGGGGGGGAAGPTDAGFGGGSGAYSSGVFEVTPGDVFSILVGDGGDGGAAGGGAGGGGGVSSFGSLVSATGGGGGAGSAGQGIVLTPSFGGTGYGGQFIVNGGGGGPGFPITGMNMGGLGAPAFLGRPTQGAGTVGPGGLDFGGGGGGAANNAAGGAGFRGRVAVRF